MTTEARNVELTRAFLRSFETRNGENLSFYAPSVIQQEFPNRLVDTTTTRDLAALRAGAERGKQTVRSERYEIVNLVAQGDAVACEVIWTGVLDVAFGALQPGDAMRAHIAMFLIWRDGKIIEQRNYDCFHPFTR